MITENKKPKRTGLSKALKDQKRKEAETRNAIYQSLSFEQKITRQKYGGRVYRKLMIQKELTA